MPYIIRQLAKLNISSIPVCVIVRETVVWIWRWGTLTLNYGRRAIVVTQAQRENNSVDLYCGSYEGTVIQQ